MGRGIILFLLLLCVLVSGCVNQPKDITSKNIGISGGEIEITNPESPIFGVKIQILENTLPTEITLSLNPVQEFPNKTGCIVENGFYISSNKLIQTSNPILIVIPFRHQRAENKLRLVFPYNTSSKQWHEEPVTPLPSPEPDKFFGTINSLTNDIAYFSVVCDIEQMV